MVDLGMEEAQSERKLPIPRLREALEKALPGALSLEKVDSFDSLLLCQLRENLNRSDAEDYFGSRGGEVAYGLPCDIREIKGEYFLFLPRVANWHYTRRLPVRGEHSPLNETYGFKHHVFVAILEKIAGVDHKTFFESYQPLEIGENFDSERTPYHRFYWTEKGAFLELYSQPTVAQAVKLNFMKERLSSLVPFKIEIVSSSSENKPLKAVESLAAEVRLPGVSVEAEFSACYGKAHEVALSPANKIEVISQSRGAPGSKLNLVLVIFRNNYKR